MRRAACFALVLVPVLLGNAACGTTPRASLDDAQLMVRVKTALLNDQEVGLLKIDVRVKDGVVTLSGPGGTPAQRQKAADLARKVEGVRDVRWEDQGAKALGRQGAKPPIPPS